MFNILTDRAVSLRGVGGAAGGILAVERQKKKGGDICAKADLQ
jgi:hypothetical protein